MKTILQVNRSSGSRVANCYCDSILRDSFALVLLSIFGSHNSVRAVWARLRSDYGSAYIGGEHVSLSKGFRYLKMQSPLDKGLTHLILIEEQATHQISNASSFYQVGSDPDKSFFTRLDRLCSVPFRKEWAPYLWQKGIEQRVITSLQGFGMPGHRISTEEDNWSKIVISGLEENLIS